MNKTSAILFILFILTGIFYYQLTDPKTIREIKISEVIDGDTLKTTEGEKIRLKGINTPESDMPLSEEAKNLLEFLTKNKTLKLESHGTDKYGRTLGYIFEKSQNINEKILSRGLATLYYYEKDNHYKNLKQAEEFARINEQGLWKKSKNTACIELVEFKIDEPELLTLKNHCDYQLNITFKDDATHIYKATIKSKSEYSKSTSHIWNDDGDSLYVHDQKGLLLFYRY
jgi:endonuclease YncB( thermonuclease family)